MTLSCGIDVGGTKIAGGVVDDDGNILEELRVESPATDAEAIEEISLKQVEAIRATGASFMNVVAYGVLPQVLTRFVGFATYQFDSNLRNSTMVGIVGAGGIGQELVVAIRKFFYSDVSAILLMIIVTVFVIDIATGWARGRLFGKGQHA